MDYKELIEKLKYSAPHNCTWLQLRNRMLDAATAIETLLAERNTAISLLRETNWCAGCIHFRGLKGCANNAMSLCCEGNDHYQFFAPGKGDKNDG